MLPAGSLTAVVTVTLYTDASSCPFTVNIAWLALQLKSAQPGLSEVIFAILTVEQSTFSFQLIVTLLSMAAAGSPSAGVVFATAGAVLSTVTLLPAPGDSTLLAESVALLLIV